MTYDIPFWNKTKEDDHFDYKLRNKEEVYYQMFMIPPKYEVTLEREIPIQYVLERATANRNRYNKVRLLVDIKDMAIFPLQLERLCFLLGPRYKNDYKIKLNVNVDEDFKVNVGKGLDMLRQLYIESIRAPIEMVGKTEIEKERLLENFVGGREHYENLVKFYKDKTTEEYKTFQQYYPKIISPNLTRNEKLSLWEEILSLRISQIQKAEELSENISNIDNKKSNTSDIASTKSINLFDRKKEEVLKEQLSSKLSSEAFEIFYNNENKI
jgi:hypothetical protein